MLNLMSKLFKQPREILNVIRELVEQQASNDEQRNKLTDKLEGLLSTPTSVVNLHNPLFDPLCIEYMSTHP
jgi:hypothetical protein